MADQYGRQAAMRPSDTNECQLWPCPAGKQFQGIVAICNQDAADQVYSIARCAVGHGDVAANDEDWRGVDVAIEAGSPPHELSVNMAATETIRIKSGAADKISFIVEGLLIDA